MRDWEFYKKQHLDNEIRGTLSWYQWIEDNIESPIERITFMHLILLSNQIFDDFELEVHQQVKIGTYRVDFLVVHRETDTWIVVECDGHDYHEKTKEQAAYDKKRDREFTKQGYIVLRYTGSQICNNPMEIYDDVGKIVIDKKRPYKKVQESGVDGRETDDQQVNQRVGEGEHSTP